MAVSERLRGLVMAGCTVACGLVLASCRGPLFPVDQPLTQFDRYHELRSQSEPMFVRDEYGERRPNYRGLLLRAN